MGFWGSFGSKISHGIHSLGQKARHSLKRGVKWVGSHAHSIEEGANLVGNIAGYAATGAAMVGLEPLAAGLGAVAAGAKGVSKLAGMADTAYQAGSAAHRAIDHVRAGQHGQALLAASRAQMTASGMSRDGAKDAGKKAYKRIQRARNKQVTY
jgi:hypothetical protein